MFLKKCASLTWMLLFIGSISLVSQANETTIDTHLDNNLLDKNINEITQKLRCPTCSDIPINETNSVALDTSVQISVQQLLHQGFNDQQIINYLVERYGYFGTPSADKTHANWLLWIAPIIALILAIVKINQIIRRKKNRQCHPKQIKTVLLLMGITILLSGSFYALFGGLKKVQHWYQVQNQLASLRNTAFNPDTQIILTKSQTEDLILGLRTALEEKHDNVSDWLLLGSLNLELANYQQSLQAFSIAYRLSPDAYIVKNAYGQLLIRSFNPALSQFGKKLLKEVVKENKQNLDAWNALANYYASNEMYNKALLIWQSLLLKMPDSNIEKSIIQKNIQNIQQILNQ